MLRAATREDLPAILDIYAPYVRTSTATFEYEVPTPEEFARRFDLITAQFPWLVWEQEGAIVGYAYASAPFTRAAYAWCAEPTIYLCPQAVGTGIAQKLYEALEDCLYRQGYHVMFSLVCAENEASLRFHKKFGYQISGNFENCGFKFGRWLGLVWMEKRLRPSELPSDAPCSWLSISDIDKL